MATNKQIAENVLKAVGGKENVVKSGALLYAVAFTLKDESKVDQDACVKHRRDPADHGWRTMSGRCRQQGGCFV